MRAFKTLLKAEFLDNKGGMLWAPAIIGVLMILATLTLGLPVATKDHVGWKSVVETTADGKTQTRIEGRNGENVILDGKITSDVRLPNEATVIPAVTQFVSAMPLLIVALIVGYFALIGSLSSERQDRSILFWKSMPVSDAKTVLAKLASATLVTAGIALGVAIIVNIVMLIVGALVGARFNVPAHAVLFAPDVSLATLAALVVAIVTYMLWALPVYGWVLLASAMAPRNAFLYAIVPPAALSFLEGVVLRQGYFSEWFWGRVSGAPMLTAVGPDSLDKLDVNPAAKIMQAAGEMAGSMASPNFIIGLAVGAGLIYAAIEVRRRRAL
jgi:ABC-2 type transport system permease protein